MVGKILAMMCIPVDVVMVPRPRMVTMMAHMMRRPVRVVSTRSIAFGSARSH
jgi:hypothetical protein